MPTTWGGAPRDDEQSILRDLGDLLSNKVKRLVCRICWVFEIGARRTPRREGYAHGDTVLGRAILCFGDWVILAPYGGARNLLNGFSKRIGLVITMPRK